MSNDDIELFEVGDRVTRISAILAKGVFEVIRIIPVPEDEIECNPRARGGGGVGHPQWLILKDYDGKISGLLVKRVKD